MDFSPEYLAEDNSAPLFLSCVVFLALETVFMGLLYASRCVAGEQQKANWTMMLLMTGAYMVCVSKISVGILMIQIGGAGRHLVALSPSTIETALKLNVVLQIACPLATSLSKLGALSLFHTVFGHTSRKYRLVIRGTALLVLAIMLLQFILPFANCRPFSYNWDMQGVSGTCAIAPLSLWRYISIPNVVTTILVVGIPIPALYRLRVSPATRAGLGVVLTFCLAGVAAAIMRFEAFLKVPDFNDITYAEIKPLCWTIAESGVYLIAGVLPTLRPLVRKLFGDGVFDRILSVSFRSSRSSNSLENRRWSHLVLMGENAAKAEDKEEKICKDICTELTTVKSRDEEKCKISQ